MSIRLLNSAFNGKKIVYSQETVFLIQVGKGYKGSYKSKFSVKGNLAQAVTLYNGINLGRGYKKRLLMPSARKSVLARAFSFPTPVKGEHWMFRK